MNNGLLPMVTGLAVSACGKIQEIEVKADGAGEFRFDNIPQHFRNLKIMGMARGSNASLQQNLYMRLNGSGDPAAVTLYDYQITGSAGSGTSNSQVTGARQWQISATASNAHTAGIFLPFTLELPMYSAADCFKCALGQAFPAIPAINITGINFFGIWRSMDAIQSIRFVYDSGNFAAGSRISLYGLN